MILADTSVWIDHLRRGDGDLVELLEQGEVCVHPMVIGELACGSMNNRSIVMDLLRHLPSAVVARDDEVMHMIEERRLMGRGLGWIDIHLLAATLLTPDTRLWTRDSRLAAAASRAFVGRP